MDDGQLASIRKAERESHLAVYDAFPLYAPGSWLAKPVKTVLDLLPRFAGYSSLRALDLGCGVGRNSIPVARAFAHIPCRVDCVDILEEAIQLLRENAIRYGVAHVIRGIPAAIDAFEIAPGGYDLILAVSALEHCDCRAALVKKLRQIRDGLRPGGIACLVINSGIREQDSASGVALTPQFEVNLPTAELQHILEQVFDGWVAIRQTVVHQRYEIPRSGIMALLETDVVSWVVEKGKERAMDFQDVYNIQDEVEQIQATYQLFNEDTRLNRSKAARVEFLTNTRYMERYLKPGARILDVGAGAGEYSLYLARKGYQVCALELAERNIQAFRRKLTPEDSIELVQGNAVDLGRYESESFDAVLLFGPLYHLHRLEDRKRCIEEAKRVCKKDGKLFFAFISHDMVILTEFSYRPDYFLTGDYDKESFRLEDFPFVFHTVDACRELLRGCGVPILHEVASDGASELLADRINAMDDENYAQYLRYHFYICEKKEFLGMTNHLLFVGEKGID